MALDPFDLLGLPPTFELDAATLERAFLRASRRLHPDHADPGSVSGGLGDGIGGFVDPSAAEEAEALLARLTEARRTLSRGEGRARVLVDRFSRAWGVPSVGEPGRLSPEFLMRIMEVREAVESDLSEGGSDASKRAEWESWAIGERERYSEGVARCFAGVAGDVAPADAADRIGEVRRILDEWRYIERLLEQLDGSDGDGPTT